MVATPTGSCLDVDLSAKRISMVQSNCTESPPRSVVSAPYFVRHSPMGYSDFNEFFVFPRHRDIVYVICLRRKEAKDFIPFYVGESSRSVGRFGDYIASKFTASTDFQVGQAIQYLHECVM